jgi:hydrogenase maturation protease
MALRQRTLIARKLRRDATEVERRLWRALGNSGTTWKFRRQHPIGGRVVDFACPACKLAIELDGGQHDEQQQVDALRSREIAAYGYRVIRFWNNEVVENLEGVVTRILREVEEPPPHPDPLRPEGRRGRGTGTVVLGVGNPDRGDDAVGRAVARLLRVPAGVQVLELDGEATAILTALQGSESAWLIDAAQSGAPAGTIHRIDCCVTGAVIPCSTVSSHGFGVAEAIALARALDTLPPRCIVYAIEAAGFSHGAPLSPAVAHAAHEVAERILAELTPPPPLCPRPRHPAPATDRR